MMAVNAARYEFEGWVHDLYIAPTMHFPYPGLEWITPLPAAGMHAVYAIIGVSALGIAAGALYRASVVVFAMAFTYVELLDRTTYLNHYYLVSILAALLFFAPLGRVFSVDARLRGSSGTLPRWPLVALRAQLGLVYVFAGIAKLRSDWLLRGEPLSSWLARWTDAPLVGPLMDEPWLGLAMSWGGALFDLGVVPLLLWKRTRLLAYLGVLVFHGLTAALFPIGIFPWMMIAATPLFFETDWPRRLFRRGSVTVDANGAPLPRWGLALLGLHFAMQLLLPLRQHLYGGDTEWHEQGFRFSWNVMVIEKTGVVDFIVRDARGRETVVHPREELTPLQLRMMQTQPDLILAYAHHLRNRFERDGHGRVEVRVDAWVSLNGRPRARLIDPEVDLAAQSDGFADKGWILPQPLP